jgi:hypothetical protein
MCTRHAFPNHLLASSRANAPRLFPKLVYFTCSSQVKSKQRSSSAEPVMHGWHLTQTGRVQRMQQKQNNACDKGHARITDFSEDMCGYSSIHLNTYELNGIGV